jgi:hypothetical protein
MNSASRVTCLLLAGLLSQVIGCGAFPEGLFGADPLAEEVEETWTPVYTPMTSIGVLLQGASNDPPDAAPSLEVTSGTVELDTDAVTITVGDTVYTGAVRTQTDGQETEGDGEEGTVHVPEVAEFTFASIHLGSDVTMTTKGNRICRCLRMATWLLTRPWMSAARGGAQARGEPAGWAAGGPVITLRRMICT